MGDPAKLAQAEQQMRTCIDRIEEAVEDVVKLATDAAEAKVQWEKAKAEMLLKTIGNKELSNAELREAWVLTQPGMEQLYYEHKIADAVATSSLARQRALIAEGDLLRSVAKGERDLAEFHGGRR